MWKTTSRLPGERGDQPTFNKVLLQLGMVKEALAELALTLERVAEQPPSVVVQVRPLGTCSLSKCFCAHAACHGRHMQDNISCLLQT